MLFRKTGSGMVLLLVCISTTVGCRTVVFLDRSFQILLESGKCTLYNVSLSSEDLSLDTPWWPLKLVDSRLLDQALWYSALTILETENFSMYGMTVDEELRKILGQVLQPYIRLMLVCICVLPY